MQLNSDQCKLTDSLVKTVIDFRPIPIKIKLEIDFQQEEYLPIDLDTSKMIVSGLHEYEELEMIFSDDKQIFDFQKLKIRHELINFLEKCDTELNNQKKD